MVDTRVKDLTAIISRLELLHGELRREYENAKTDFEAIEKIYLETRENFTYAADIYHAADEALKRLDVVKNRMNNPILEQDGKDWF